MKRLILMLALIATICAPAFAADNFVLVDNGQPKATIVIRAEDNAKPKVAATELQTYIKKITGAELKIVTDAENPPKVGVVLVGRSKLTDAAGVKIESKLTPSRREEFFLIDCKQDRLILAGNDAQPYRGTEYAVYDFLNRLGVRWYMPGDFGEIVPQSKSVSLAAMRVMQKPDFIMRDWWSHLAELEPQETLWKIRNKMNTDRMFATPGDSSARNITASADLLATKPELFAMNQDGSRNIHLPNLTNPEAVKVAADIIKEYFRKNPTENSYGFAPDDGLPRDFNPDTVKINRGFADMTGRPGVEVEASTTEEWITFVNNVTSQVRAEFPDAYIATNGYSNRNLPPVGVPVDDHVVTMFAAIWSCTLHAYDDPHCWQKERQGMMLKKWCELCPNVWIYGYNYQMLMSGLTPLPETRKLRRDFPLMKKWGVIGFLDETRKVWAEAGIASRYLRARLEWDANLDVDTLLDDFYGKWYGKSALAMESFYEAIEDAIEQSPVHGHEDRVMPEIYTDELLVKLEPLMARAEKLAEGDSEAVKTRVHSDRLILDHLKAYVAMSRADVDGRWDEAAAQGEKMLELRVSLNAISPFFIKQDEEGYDSGLWYWKIRDRVKYYKGLAENARVSGTKTELVAMLPRIASFRIDPHEDGIAQEWYKPSLPENDWRQIDTGRPFYAQGYNDNRGFPYVGQMWYRFKVDVPAIPKGTKTMLVLPVVETEAWVWVNGEYIGHRPYAEAYTKPIEVRMDVTKAIKPGKTNEIAVRVFTSLNVASAASGLQCRGMLYSWGPD